MAQAFSNAIYSRIQDTTKPTSKITRPSNMMSKPQTPKLGGYSSNPISSSAYANANKLGIGKGLSIASPKDEVRSQVLSGGKSTIREGQLLDSAQRGIIGNTYTPPTPIKSSVGNVASQNTYTSPQMAQTTPQMGGALVQNKYGSGVTQTGTDFSGSTPNLVGQTVQPYESEYARQTGNNPEIRQNKILNPQDTQAPAIPQTAFGSYLQRGDEAYKEAAKFGQEAAKMQEAMQRTTRDVMGNPYYSGSVKTGQAANISQQMGSQLQALTGQQQAMTGLGSGLSNLAGQAAPVQVSYGAQYVDPTTGTLVGGTQGVNSSLQGAVQNAVQKLNAGQMSYDDAISSLSGYGQGGINALQQALPPNFNIAQSNALAGQQGTIGVSYQLADVALKNVEDVLNRLMPAQTTNIPLINRAANWVSSMFGVGSQQTREMTGAVQSLRNAYASLLASVKGGTPTDYSSQAMAEIPNEPTPNDIAAVRHNFEVLGQARTQILGNPAYAGGTQTNTQSGGGLYNW